MKTKKTKTHHDHGKFLFNGEKLGKGRLVLAIIKKMALKNPNLTKDQLMDDFARTKVHTSFDIVMPVNKAHNTRYFLNKDSVLTIENKKVAVTNQWGIDNIYYFIKIARKMGFSIRAIS